MSGQNLRRNWPVGPLGEFCSVSPRDPALPNDAPFVPMSSVEVGHKHPHAYEPRGTRGGVRARANDVLFARITPCLENGKVALLPADAPPTGGSTEFIVVRPGPSVLPEYLFYWCLNPDVRSLAEARMAGATGRMRLSGTELARFDFPLPPPAEQRRIVEVLEAHLSRLDAAEANLKRISSRSRALEDLITNEIVLGCAEPAIRFGSPRSDLRGKHARFDYQALPPLPEHWHWRLASDVCENIASGSTPPAALMQPGSGEIPFLKVYNVAPEGFIDFSKDPTFVDYGTHQGKLKRSTTRPGDVVTNIVGPPLGKSAVIPPDFPEWNHNQALVSFRAGADLDPNWLATCLRAPFVVNLLKSTAKATAGQFNIALSTCRELPLPVPPIEVQRRLLSRRDQSQDQIRRTRTTATIAIQRSNALRQSVLRAAFASELVDHDHADELIAETLAGSRSR